MNASCNWVDLLRPVHFMCCERPFICITRFRTGRYCACVNINGRETNLAPCHRSMSVGHEPAAARPGPASQAHAHAQREAEFSRPRRRNILSTCQGLFDVLHPIVDRDSQQHSQNGSQPVTQPAFGVTIPGI